MKTLALAALFAISLPCLAFAQSAPIAPNMNSGSDSIRDQIHTGNQQGMAQDADTGMGMDRSPNANSGSMNSIPAVSPSNISNDTTYIAPQQSIPAQQTKAEQAQAPTAAAPNTVVEAKPAVGGDLRAPSPKIFDVNRRGYFQAGVGPAYGIGFVSDSLMYNVQASYNFNIDDRITVRGLTDLYMASGSVSSRMIDLGVGADLYAPEVSLIKGVLPYATADLAIANARNAEDKTATGLAIGGGAGFKFQASELNWDITAHYALLTEQISSRNPSILSLRAALNF